MRICLHHLIKELHQALEPYASLPYKTHEPSRKSLHHRVMGLKKRKDYPPFLGKLPDEYEPGDKNNFYVLDIYP